MQCQTEDVKEKIDGRGDRAGYLYSAETLGDFGVEVEFMVQTKLFAYLAPEV